MLEQESRWRWSYRQTDRQTDRRTDRQTDGQTEGQVECQVLLVAEDLMKEGEPLSFSLRPTGSLLKS